MNTYEYAKFYASKGFSVIPVKKTKKPVFAWKDYQRRFPTDEELREWFDNDKDYNIGIITGAISKISVVDLDGEKAISYAKEYKFPKTPTVKTGNGYHLYCQYKEGAGNFQSREDLPDIDFRGDGGYVVAPPSTHMTGHVYQWCETRSMNDLPYATVPEIIFKTNSSGKIPFKELSTGVSSGKRNNSLVRMIGLWISSGNNFEECLDHAFSWNSQNTPPLSVSEVERTVESIFKLNETKNEEPWQEPIPFETSTPSTEFPLDALPAVCKEIVSSVAEVNQVDPSMPATIVLGVLSACLAKKGIVYLQSHKEPLNLYLITIAGSGERKSSTFKVLTKPIFEYQKILQDNAKNEITLALNKKKVLDQELKIQVQKSVKATSGIDYDIEENNMRDISNKITEFKIPPNPCLILDDVTTESLGIKMFENSEKLAVLSAEGGIFEIMTGLYNEKGYNLDLPLKSHTGDPCCIARVSRDDLTMESPALTFCLAVQPGVIRNLGKKKSLRHLGLIARFLFSNSISRIGTRKRQYKIIPDELEKSYNQLITTLLEMDGTDKKLHLSREASDLWDENYNIIEHLLLEGNKLSSLQDWGSKFPGNIARIAGLLHMAEYGQDGYDLEIGIDTMKSAIDIGKFFLSHALPVFEIIEEDSAIATAKIILDIIISNNLQSFTINNIVRKKNCFKKNADIEPGIKILSERSFIRKRITNKNKAEIYDTNPAIFNINEIKQIRKKITV